MKGHDPLVRSRQQARAASRGNKRMPMTFFVVGNRSQTQRIDMLADYLKSRGLRWVMGIDWVSPSLTDDGRMLYCALAADVVVVVIDSPGDLSTGLMLGARLSHSKETHVVTTADLAINHPCLVYHADLESCLGYLFGT